MRTRTSSGASVVAAATSASSPHSNTGFTPWGRSCWPDRSSIPSRMPPGALPFTGGSPPLPFLPRNLHGKQIVMVGACYAGAPDDGIEVVRPLKEFGSPIVDLLELKPYLALQSMFDRLVPPGWHRYRKSVELPPLTEEAIDTL